MIVVDSCGWLEYVSQGSLANRYEELLKNHGQVLTPAIVLYEVYKKVKKEAGQEAADTVAIDMSRTTVIPLDDAIAILAADISLEHRLAMADAIVYATAQMHHAKLYTSDADFAKLPDVAYVKK